MSSPPRWGRSGSDLALDTPTSALSGGQTQRLALAGTLALDPAVVLLDEPTAMLDPASAQEVRDAVAALGRRARRTHRRSSSSSTSSGPWVDLVDRLVVLSDDGVVVADGPVRATLEAERERLLAMGIWVPGEGPPEAGRRRRRAGRRLEPPHVAAAGGATLRATPLVVERTTRLVDGTVRTRRAA